MDDIYAKAHQYFAAFILFSLLLVMAVDTAITFLNRNGK